MEGFAFDSKELRCIAAAIDALNAMKDDGGLLATGKLDVYYVDRFVGRFQQCMDYDVASAPVPGDFYFKDAGGAKRPVEPDWQSYRLMMDHVDRLGEGLRRACELMDATGIRIPSPIKRLLVEFPDQGFYPGCHGCEDPDCTGCDDAPSQDKAASQDEVQP